MHLEWLVVGTPGRGVRGKAAYNEERLHLPEAGVVASLDQGRWARHPERIDKLPSQGPQQGIFGDRV